VPARRRRSSAGQGRLVELARALARGPNLLLLDAAESSEFARLLVRLVEGRDLGILIVEHDMNLVLTICHWIYVLDWIGKPLMERPPEQVRAGDLIRDAYPGESSRRLNRLSSSPDACQHLMHALTTSPLGMCHRRIRGGAHGA
jgi:ABC-type lipopolysaccharide export system ATPase subunit